MLSFTIDKQKCTRCGQCVLDCPVKIIAMDGDYPAIAAEKESSCFECQHCLAVCPTGAVSILGKIPEKSVSLSGNLPSPETVETLIKGRRSVRQYKDENIKPELIQRLLEVSCHAPTGVNSRQVLYTVIDDKEIMGELRRKTMEGLARLLREGKLPPGRDILQRLCPGLGRRGDRHHLPRGSPSDRRLGAAGLPDSGSGLPDCARLFRNFRPEPWGRHCLEWAREMDLY